MRSTAAASGSPGPSTVGAVPPRIERQSPCRPAMAETGSASSQPPGPPSRRSVASAEARTAPAGSSTPRPRPVEPEVTTTRSAPSSSGCSGRSTARAASTAAGGPAGSTAGGAVPSRAARTCGRSVRGSAGAGTGVRCLGTRPHGTSAPCRDPPRACEWWGAAAEAACDGWPAPVRDAVPVNVTVPAVGPERAHAIVTASGCRTAKVKVAEPGQTAAEDVARVEAVRDALGPDGAIRVDANAAWDVDTAAARIRELDRVGLEYVEQPCASLGELAALRRRVDVRVAADEVVRRSADPLRVDLRGACDVVVLKVQPLGGVRAALEVAGAHGLPCVVSSALESSVGIAAGVALAAALPELPFACGLATVALLAGDVTSDPLLPVDGALPVRTVTPDRLTEVAGRASRS